MKKSLIVLLVVFGGLLQVRASDYLGGDYLIDDLSDKQQPQSQVLSPEQYNDLTLEEKEQYSKQYWSNVGKEFNKLDTLRKDAKKDAEQECLDKCGGYWSYIFSSTDFNSCCKRHIDEKVAAIIEQYKSERKKNK